MVLRDERASAIRRLGPLEALLERRLQGTGLSREQLWEALEVSGGDYREIVQHFADLSAVLTARSSVRR